MTGNTALPSATDLTVREVAAELGSTTKFVYNLIERRELTVIKYGQRFIRITRAALDAFKDAHTTPAAKRATLLDDETRAHLAELASAATALTEEQKDTIRAAFKDGGGRDSAQRAVTPKLPRPVPRPKRSR